MGLFDKEKTSNITVRSPREVFTSILRTTSGAMYQRSIDFDIFYQVVAFKGVVDGVGTSTLVANTAIAIAKLGLTVCVIDSSVLNPVQDVLLKTNWRDVDAKNRKDWFDIMYTDQSVLHESKIDSNISVLSFKGKKHDITDIMGTKDSGLLVETAISILHSKFDIILIDCCQEVTKINASCIQQAQKVVQVWSDSPHIISNIDTWVTNNVILSCPLDKMRYVVISKFVGDIIYDFDSMLNQYRFVKLGTCRLSLDIARVNAIGKTLWDYASDSEDIIEFNNCIIDIVCHLLNIEEEKEEESKGKFTVNDIMDGKVDGTLHHKYKSNEGVPEIYRTLEEADKSLNGGTVNGKRTSDLESYQIDTSEDKDLNEYLESYRNNADTEENVGVVRTPEEFYEENRRSGSNGKNMFSLHARDRGDVIADILEDSDDDVFSAVDSNTEIDDIFHTEESGVGKKEKKGFFGLFRRGGK